MSTCLGVTNFQKTVQFFWLTLYIQPDALTHAIDIQILRIEW